jgi:hypothetical protein
VNDPHLMIAIGLGIAYVALIVVAFQRTRVIRKVSHLQNNVERLSREVQELQVAEQRRFIMELNASKEGNKSAIAAPETPVSASVSPLRPVGQSSPALPPQPSDRIPSSR